MCAGESESGLGQCVPFSPLWFITTFFVIVFVPLSSLPAMYHELSVPISAQEEEEGGKTESPSPNDGGRTRGHELRFRPSEKSTRWERGMIDD